MNQNAKAGLGLIGGAALAGIAWLLALATEGDGSTLETIQGMFGFVTVLLAVLGIVYLMVSLRGSD